MLETRQPIKYADRPVRRTISVEIAFPDAYSANEVDEYTKKIRDAVEGAAELQLAIHCVYGAAVVKRE